MSCATSDCCQRDSALQFRPGSGFRSPSGALDSHTSLRTVVRSGHPIAQLDSFAKLADSRAASATDSCDVRNEHAGSKVARVLRLRNVTLKRRVTIRVSNKVLVDEERAYHT